MERNQINGRISPSTSSTATTRSSSLHPDYGSRAVKEALEHLASVDLIELCGEAKVERCRATRDLRSCGRYVHYVLNSCGHASLCSECSQRCDLCPICRIPVPKTGNRLRLRLYYECIEAGLISEKCDERFQEKDDGDDQLAADAMRLYSLFDVAIENNLSSLICHYVADVCMDESAVSSDPVIAFLLDEVVVKDWCKKTFRSIVEELQEIYTLQVEEMRSRLNQLFKISTHLAGILNVLEVLESSFKGSLMAKLHDLHSLQDSILKTRQHLEVMIWCIRHQFLENVRSVHTDLTSWRSVVRERKSASTKRSWPEVGGQPAKSSIQAGSLFIEDALTNIEAELEDTQDIGGESYLASLENVERSFLRSKLEGLVGCYPFENLRVAVDLLFLHGCSDMVAAKEAILLYYLFDRHWTVPDDIWRSIVDDFVAAFGITRHSMLESLTFYLLDNHTDEALQVACEFLLEISGPSTHPKIAQVLLEREVPEKALMVLRLSARDGSDLITLSEAVTAVRVRLECGLLTEAFMHQRMLCSKVKENKWKGGLLGETTNDSKGKRGTGEEWLELLVSEICCLCIKSNLVDRMIELPWNLDEEKYIYKCLLDFAVHDPSTTSGSLLVVYYLQRYRYAEAYQVDLKLQALEQEFISKSTSEEVSSRMRSTSQWRAALVVQSIGLLSQDQRQLIKSGQLWSEIHDNSGEVVEILSKSGPAILQEPESSILLAPQFAGSFSFSKKLSPRREAFGTPSRLDGSISSSHFEIGSNRSLSILHERLLANVPKPEVGSYRSGKYDGISSFRIQHGDLVNDRPFKKISRTPSNLISNSTMDQHQPDITVEMEQIGFATQFRNTGSPYTRRVTAEPVFLSHNKQGLQNDYGLTAHSHLHDKLQKFSTGDDPMDISWRENDLVVDDKKIVNGGPRWRSDETSDEDEDHVPDRVGGMASFATPSREKRRISFARR